jgi:hypothetical protein
MCRLCVRGRLSGRQVLRYIRLQSKGLERERRGSVGNGEQRTSRTSGGHDDGARDTDDVSSLYFRLLGCWNRRDAAGSPLCSPRTPMSSASTESDGRAGGGGGVAARDLHGPCDRGLRGQDPKVRLLSPDVLLRAEQRCSEQGTILLLGGTAAVHPDHRGNAVCRPLSSARV